MKRDKFCLSLLLLLLPVMFCAGLQDSDRFPRPEFRSGYLTPSPTTPLPTAPLLEYADAAVLLLCLCVVTWLALVRRSRSGILAAAVFSVAYFGFWRKGCVCAVGAIQNITLALFNPAYTVPVSVIIFFLLPLLFTLFFGRTFCAAVCPLGALQELVAVKPKPVPAWLAKGLGMIPVVYLVFTVLFAATGAEFIICRFDPFVGFFRFGGYPEMIIFGIVILVSGIFIARPYCRFLCPYGVLLGWLSALSHRHLTITPDKCIQCRLCENSCPTGSINKPAPAEEIEPAARGIRRLVVLGLLLPLLALSLGFTFSALAPLFARVHPVVQTAREVAQAAADQPPAEPLRSDTFRASGESRAELQAEAAAITGSFRTGGWLAGIALAIILFLKLVSLARKPSRQDYEPERLTCISCGRCFASCPREQVRRRAIAERKGTTNG